MSTPQPRLYFAYGSNLSLTQMSLRCPTSTYHSLAVLKNYTWVIGPRGYANVIATPPSHPQETQDQEQGEEQGQTPENSKSQSGEKDTNQVYGLLYTLEEEDEVRLDIAEGVPECYTKSILEVEIISSSTSSTVVEALVYIDEVHTEIGVCQEEYVARMNRGIRDAVERGMPREYVEGVLRRWVREEIVGDGDVEDPFFPGVEGE